MPDWQPLIHRPAAYPVSDTTPLPLPAPPATGFLARWLAPAALTSLAYFLTGQLALLLAIPPGYAAPIYPSAGLALAAVLVYGRGAILGTVLGAFAVNLLLGNPREVDSAAALLLPLANGLGAGLQAAVGAALVRWRLPGPLVLGEPRDVAGFFLLGALVACLVNSSVSTLALSWAGVVPPGSRAFTWWTWWAGDALGVLIGAPIVLAAIGRPHADWAPRRITLAVPLLATTALLALATVLVARWDSERSRSVFERDAQAAAARLEAELQQALFALEAVHGLYIGSDDVSADELRRVAQPWLALQINIQAIGYSPRVARSDIPKAQAEVAASQGGPYRIFDRSPIAEMDSHVLAIRLIEPRASNAGALGVNSLSVPAARAALLGAIADDTPVATSGFAIAQEPGKQTGVVVYRALYRGQPAAAQRRDALTGVVFVTLRMQQSVAAAMAKAQPYLGWCLVDTNPQAERQRLAGPAGCETAAPRALHLKRPIALAGQQWLLHIGAEPRAVPDAGHGNAWLFSTVGLLSAAMLAALLLTVTGRTRRIETAVAARTRDLQREVGERQRTESALRESEERFRNMFEHAPIGIVYADLRGRVRDANPRLRELIGYDSVALAGKRLSDMSHPDDRAEDADSLQRLLNGELSEVQRNTRLQHHDGQMLWVRMNWTVLRNLQGRPQRLVAVVEDITEQLRRHEAEQGRQAAESANRAKNEFLSRMSHELRTPLNAMLGFAQLLDLDHNQRLAPHQLAWVAQILQAGWHLLEMINDTLDLSRIEAGMLRLEPTPVMLQPLLSHCLAMVGPAAARRGIELELHIGADVQRALADETRLKQVITNLVSNAVKYNVQGGRVVVRAVRESPQMVAVRVLDTGLGLSEAQMAELFQPYNRLGRENSDTEGTGIGLVISRRLAELMDGTLHAESVQGQGATFVLRLPWAAESEPSADAAVALDDEPDRYRHRLVHYVEDNETNVEVMRGMLAQRPQVTLDVSTLGLDGLTAIRARRPDLILLDMHLPDVDGLELLRQLQRDPQCADIPVVVVSADATPARIQEALAAGARHYLTKPVNLIGFLEVIDDLLDTLDTRTDTL